MKDEITIKVNAPCTLTDEQAKAIGREIQRGMRLAVVRSYVPSQRDLDLTRPRFSSIPWPFPTSEPKACFECCQPETCRRIDMCVAHKCRFGEDDAP